jgi:hypothetical protein
MLNSKALTASASAPKVYIEDVFSTWLYTGNGSTQTITNGIDLSGKGGLVWIKGRGGVSDHILQHNTTQYLSSSSTAAASDPTSVYVTSFGSTGFSLGFGDAVNKTTAPSPYASWTFRKAAKFFDVCTWTGDGTSPRAISHNLGSVPGCIIIKTLSTTSDWLVYHRSLGADKNLRLNTTAASQTNTSFPWQNTSPTSTTFTVDNDGWTNGGGQTYVAYLFAHDAGGFGDSGNDSVVKCGIVNEPGTGVTVDLGWEPQWVLLKRTSSTGGNWRIIDNMRGWPMYAQASRQLFPNTSGAEDASEAWGNPTATGFFLNAAATGDYIYIAIRRGPMKTPTDATKVFSAITSSSATGTTLTTNFPLDFQIERDRVNVGSTFVLDRLRGVNTTGVNGMDGPYLRTNGTTAETSDTTRALSDSWSNVSFKIGSSLGGVSSIYYSFRRAPGFMDVVAYTGTSATASFNHSLGVKPELIILKNRSGSGNNWAVLCEYCTNGSIGSSGRYLFLNTTNAENDNSGNIFPSAPTSTQFTVGSAGIVNFGTMIAYLFATCPGVSKVGSYTGSNSSTVQVDCGFTNGARFVLLKRTDAGSSGFTGNWVVFDTARGIVSGNDPYIFLNSTSAENVYGGADGIDPYSAGFELVPGTIFNETGGTYIYLAIA